MSRRVAICSLWSALAAAACSSLPVVARDGGADTGSAPAGDGGACGRPCGDGVECIGGVCSRRVLQLSSELNHTCAVVSDGSVWCWGSNENGEVGDGSMESTRPTPSRVPGVTASSVGAGWTHTCAVAGGRVRCWGNNDGRQIADDARPVIRAPEAVDLPSRAVSVQVAFGACALLDDGVVHCRSPFRAFAPHASARWADHVVALDGGWGHVCALRDDGTVGCAGRRVVGQLGDGVMDPDPDAVVVGPAPPSGLPPVAAIASGADGTCARTVDGVVWCWGKSYARSAAHIDWTPARVDLGGVRELWGGGHAFFVRGTDGVLRAWGDNLAGVLGDGTTTARRTPVPMTALADIAGEVVTFAVGLDHACALLRDQTVRCWGSNVRGQIGNGALGARVLTPQSPRW